MNSGTLVKAKKLKNLESLKESHLLIGLLETTNSCLIRVPARKEIGDIYGNSEELKLSNRSVTFRNPVLFK